MLIPQNELLTITDIDPIKVEFKIPLKDLPLISIGQAINLNLDSFPGQTFKGGIEAIDTKIDPISQQIEIRGTLENNKHLFIILFLLSQSNKLLSIFSDILNRVKTFGVYENKD